MLHESVSDSLMQCTENLILSKEWIQVMGQYSTQTRRLPLLDFYQKTSSPNGFVDFDSGMVTGPQITRSYRSGTPSEAVVSKADLLEGGRPYASRYDNGHSFSTQKLDIVYDRSIHARKISRSTLVREGHVIPAQLVKDIQSYTTALPVPSFDSTLWGNRAIADTNPSASVADLSVFLGEFLRDGLPSAVGSTLTKPGLSKRQLARKSGGEYLNLQFGWVPLVKDIEKMLKVVQDSYAILAQYQRDDGRHVRRSKSYPQLISKVDNPVVTQLSHMGSTYDPYQLLASLSMSTTTTQKIKFSGAYTYHIPVDNSLLGKAAKYAALADKLLGIGLTPDRLWNLMPWTWLVDWWAEIGPALEARQALSTNGQVLQYGYLQRKTTVLKSYDYTLRPYNGVSGVRRTAYLRLTKKERVRATPFGFGISDEAISAPQMAILSALGISLGDGKLRKMGY